MKKPYRIVIAEDHTILREGLRSLLSSNPDFDVAGGGRLQKHMKPHCVHYILRRGVGYGTYRSALFLQEAPKKRLFLKKEDDMSNLQ